MDNVMKGRTHLALFVQEARQIARGAVPVHDADGVPALDPRVVAGDDVRVLQALYQLHLAEGRLALCIRLPGEAHSLHHITVNTSGALCGHCGKREKRERA